MQENKRDDNIDEGNKIKYLSEYLKVFISESNENWYVKNFLYFLEELIFLCYYPKHCFPLIKL